MVIKIELPAIMKMNENETEGMEEDDDSGKSPEEWASHWQTEIKASQDWLKNFRAQAKRAMNRFKDSREETLSSSRRLNLYTANITTQLAMLYGKPPQSSVSRKFGDSSDDVARVAGTMMERMLNSDIERADDTYDVALANSLKDFRIAGLGSTFLRYVVESETVEAADAIYNPMDGSVLVPAMPEHEKLVHEDVEVDHVNQEDLLWSMGARTHVEVRWMSNRKQMSRKELVARFGKKIGNKVPLNSRKQKDGQSGRDPVNRADVWELWSKEDKRVFWVVVGHPVVLDSKADPLELDAFFPYPRPLMSGLATDAYIPIPDYHIAANLYEEADSLESRINLLTDALVVVGIYDATNQELKDLLISRRKNEMIPVKNWNRLMEKGGLANAVEWLPLEQIVKVIMALTERQASVKQSIYEATGWSDILRGQAGEAGVTAKEQGIKAKFGSVRIQALQDEFARFASDTLNIKAQIISKHFSPETIIERSNAKFLPEHDQALIPQAIELIKSDLSCYRIEVKPEAISLTDYAAVKSERTEVIQTLAGFFTSVAPMAQTLPGSMPFLLEMAQWVVAGLRGSSEIEGTFDEMIAAVKQAQQQPKPPAPPDPSIQVAQIKAQSDLQRIQAKAQADAQQTQLEVGADAQREANQTQANVQEHLQKTVITASLRPRPEPSRPMHGGGQ